MTRHIFLFSILVVASACSAKQSSDSQQLPVCFEASSDGAALNRCCSSHCAGQVAACTEQNGGDYSACSSEKMQCESTCLGSQAIERGEGGQVITDKAPIKPTIIRDTDAGTSDDSSDASNDPID